CAVRTVTGSIPRYPQHRGIELVFSNTGQNMSPMMLNENRSFSEITSMLRGEVIRMQIARDQAGGNPVKILQIGSNSLKGGKGLTRLQIADMLADENLLPYT